MASACINNIGVPSYGWPNPNPNLTDDFEFRLHDDPAVILPADELFSDGKVMPLHLRKAEPKKSVSLPKNNISDDPSLFSPKAPRCSSHWRELLGLRKKSASSDNANQSSIRSFLHRSSKSAPPDTSLSLPLLTDSDSDKSASFSSSRLSLSSSSSSSHDDDLPRLSLDAVHLQPRPRMRTRTLKPRPAVEDPAPLIDHPSAAPPAVARGVTLDSPRLSSSGKIVFHGLERSSSSPSSLNGGPRYKHRAGVERSYSANVRVTPVLNVPLCKSGVFGLFSSTSTGSASSKTHHHHHHNYTSTGRGKN